MNFEKEWEREKEISHERYDRQLKYPCPVICNTNGKIKTKLNNYLNTFSSICKCLKTYDHRMSQNTQDRDDNIIESTFAVLGPLNDEYDNK
jgi:hypothetical protein